MRSNSGTDEARNNLHDPTLRDHERAKKDKQAMPGRGRTTEMGSHAGKSGHQARGAQR